MLCRETLGLGALGDGDQVEVRLFLTVGHRVADLYSVEAQLAVLTEDQLLLCTALLLDLVIQLVLHPPLLPDLVVHLADHLASQLLNLCTDLVPKLHQLVPQHIQHLLQASMITPLVEMRRLTLSSARKETRNDILGRVGTLNYILGRDGTLMALAETTL